MFERHKAGNSPAGLAKVDAMETDPNDIANFRTLVEISDRNLLRATFDVPLVEIIAWDPESLQVVAINKTALNAHNWTLRQAMRFTLPQIISGLTTQRILRILSMIKRRKSRHARFRIGHLDKAGRLRMSQIVLQFHKFPKPTFIAFLQDITFYQEARTAAHEARSILATAIESLPDGFVLYDADDRLVLCNDRYKDIYPQSAEAMVLGAKFREILQFGLDRAEYAEAIGREEDWLRERLLVHEKAEQTVEQRLSSGQWLRIVERLTRDGGRVGLRIDITEHKENEAKLEQYASTDPLTGLMNRRGLAEKMATLARELKAGERIAVLHVDLDKFKSINDTQGHDAGDFVLQHVGQLLQTCAGHDSIVARVGGDEFIVLMKSRQSDALILDCGHRIMRQLAKPVTFRDQICNLSACIGVAFFDPTGRDAINIAMSGADIALNEAKQVGRGQFRLFEQSMRDSTMRMIEMAQEIRLGIDAGRFEPYFQPQVNSLTGEIIGLEALIRWLHPTRGLVPAFEFLPAAERAGLMGALDEVVMDRSCAAIAEISTWGLGDICVSINMSMPQLRDRNILNRLQDHLDKYGITPDCLKIELLESTLLDERSDVIVENVHRLIQHGFLVELDDFGTGHAAIATLRKFAVSRIKIDRSLVQDINRDDELQVITGAIISLADRLGIKILAEGVETTLEEHTLQSLGCPCVQGYLHARPMPISLLKNWIIAQQQIKTGAVCLQTKASG